MIFYNIPIGNPIALLRFSNKTWKNQGNSESIMYVSFYNLLIIRP